MPFPCTRLAVSRDKSGQQNARGEPVPHALPELSVIVPTCDRPIPLDHTLSALTRQSLAADRFEVVIVDDGSSAAVAPVPPMGAWPFEVRYIRQLPRGLAAARNLGAKVARGQILVFVDDDVELAPEALAAHLSTHLDQGARTAVVGALPFGDRTPRDCFTWFLERRGHYDLYARSDKYPGGVPLLAPMNGHSSVRRQLFRDAGGYDTGLGAYGGEDLELGHRLALAGVRFHYQPAAIGYHQHTKGFDAFCRDMESSGEALVRVFARHPEIKSAKQIDLLADRPHELPARRRLAKFAVDLALRLRTVEALARAIALRGQRFYTLRAVLYPLYRWVGGCHYARGIRRGLDSQAAGKRFDSAPQ